jgi:hypothetical protein
MMEIQLILIIALCVVGQLIGTLAGNWFYDWRHTKNKGLRQRKDE